MQHDIIKENSYSEQLFVNVAWKYNRMTLQEPTAELSPFIYHQLFSASTLHLYIAILVEACADSFPFQSKSAHVSTTGE